MTDDPTSVVPVNPATNANTDQPGILVVDDDSAVLGLLHIVFAQRGFAVWAAGTGDEAVELYRRHEDAVAVVLIDVCMPGMDGPQTLAELRRVNAGVRAAFMSGFTGKHRLDDLLAMGVQGYFEKPFQIQTLAEQLWQLASAEVRRSA